MASGTDDVPMGRQLGSGLRAGRQPEQDPPAANGFEGPLSPELVLVAPPELSELARRDLPHGPATSNGASSATARTRRHVQWATVEFVAFVVLCVVVLVLGVLFFALLS